MIALTHAHGLSCEPFFADIPVEHLFPLPGLQSLRATWIAHRQECELPRSRHSPTE